MTPVANGAMQEAIAAAMGSRIGAGPARFHSSGDAGWVDTVYLGAYRVADAVAVGGYAADMSINEDAEFAIRLSSRGGVWFDPTIRSTYTPRSSLAAVARQFYRYGRGRAVTVRRHPASLSPRQLAAPALVLGILSPWRRPVLGAYAAVVAGWSFAGRSDRPARAGLVLPAMHVPWGVNSHRSGSGRPPKALTASPSPLSSHSAAPVLDTTLRRWSVRRSRHGDRGGRRRATDDTAAERWARSLPCRWCASAARAQRRAPASCTTAPLWHRRRRDVWLADHLDVAVAVPVRRARPPGAPVAALGPAVGDTATTVSVHRTDNGPAS